MILYQSTLSVAVLLEYFDKSLFTKTAQVLTTQLLEVYCSSFSPILLIMATPKFEHFCLHKTAMMNGSSGVTIELEALLNLSDWRGFITSV